MFGTIDPVGRGTLLYDRAFVVFAIIAFLDSPPYRSISLNYISMEFLGHAPINLLSG